MSRIGLLGGSFDPPHRGHLAVALAVRAARRLDRVDLLVSGMPPHAQEKQNRAVAENRVAMARLAVQEMPELGVEDCETRRDGRTYTIDTVRSLQDQAPDTYYCFILGGDMVADLPNWKEARKLLEIIDLVPVFRPGFGSEVFAQLESRYAAGAVIADQLRRAVVEMPPVDISSTEIRRRVAAGDPIDKLVPEPIVEYIRLHGLYATPAPC